MYLRGIKMLPASAIKCLHVISEIHLREIKIKMCSLWTQNNIERGG